MLGKAALLALFVCIISNSCKKEKDDNSKPTGELQLGVNVSLLVVENENRLKAADVNEFEVTVFNEDGTPYSVFERYTDLPSVLELEEGSYYVVANSKNLVAAAFENDYYEGISDLFTIVAGETVNTTVNCSLSNVMVTVTYTENTQTSFDDYTTTVSSSTGALNFTGSETRAGYFEVRPLHIEAVLNYEEGGTPQTLNLEGDILSPEAGKHYEIIVDVTRNSGNASINITADESFETETIVLNGENEIAEKPTTESLIITEIMYNPDAISDTDGEWIEIYNTTTSPIQLQNLIIRRESTGDSHTISESLIIGASDFMILARSIDAINGVDYVYGTSITLPNSTGDNIILLFNDGNNEIEISNVNYGNITVSVAGNSIQLDPGHYNATDADDASFWCSAVSSMANGDYGTPGLNNDYCQ